MQPLFISFEGIDGCGKSTQCQLLSEHLTAQGVAHMAIREPGATAIGEKVRSLVHDPAMGMDMHTEAYLYAAARCELVNSVIKPALASGQTVICDRFVHSSLAYQGYARGMGVDTVQRINAVAVGDTTPHVTFWIDTTLATAQSRVAGGEIDRIEAEGATFQQKVLDGYKALTQQYDTIITIDGNQEPQAIHQDILMHLATYQS